MSAATISVSETLALLDGSFDSVSRGVARDEYALWLGSGISRGRLMDLPAIVRKVLTVFQERAHGGDKHYEHALRAALRLAGINDAAASGIDLSCAITGWPNIDGLVNLLISRYAHFLDIRVDDLADDFIIWELVDVPETYGDVGIPPDCEHLCIAILVLEGMISHIASANWDGLIESAFARISGASASTLKVCILSGDLRPQNSPAYLYKFHGCAVRAKHDPANYREALVGRASQIMRWRQDRPAMYNALAHLATTKPTLMVGLSAQDEDIKDIFMEAHARMPWKWPSDPPAYVFAENDLGADQMAIIHAIYREAYSAGHRAAIETSATFPAYAKQLLVALVLKTIALKLHDLINLANAPDLPAIDRSSTRGSQRFATRVAASAVTANLLHFVESFIEHTANGLTLHRRGVGGMRPGLKYQPLGVASLFRLAADPYIAMAKTPNSPSLWAFSAWALRLTRGRSNCRTLWPRQRLLS